MPVNGWPNSLRIVSKDWGYPIHSKRPGQMVRILVTEWDVIYTRQNNTKHIIKRWSIFTILMIRESVGWKTPLVYSGRRCQPDLSQRALPLDLNSKGRCNFCVSVRWKHNSSIWEELLGDPVQLSISACWWINVCNCSMPKVRLMLSRAFFRDRLWSVTFGWKKWHNLQLLPRLQPWGLV